MPWSTEGCLCVEQFIHVIIQKKTAKIVFSSIVWHDFLFFFLAFVNDAKISWQKIILKKS